MIMQVPQIEEDKPQEGEKIDAMTTSMEGIEDIPNEEKPAEAPPAEAAAAGSSHCYLRLFEDFFLQRRQLRHQKRRSRPPKRRWRLLSRKKKLRWRR